MLRISDVLDRWALTDPSLDRANARRWLQCLAQNNHYPDFREFRACTKYESETEYVNATLCSGVLVDASHTLRGLTWTGVERVTEALASRVRSRRNARVVSWQGGVLVEAELDRGESDSRIGRKSRIRNMLIRVASSDPLRPMARRLNAVTQERGRSRHPALLPNNCAVLIPETIAGRSRKTFERLTLLQHCTPMQCCVIVHDLAPKVHPEWFDKDVVSLFGSYLEFVEDASAVFAVSDGTLEEYLQFRRTQPVDDGRQAVQRVSLGVDPVDLPRHMREEKEYVCVAAVDERKNLRGLLDAFERVILAIPGASLRLITSPRAHDRKLEQRIADLEDQGCVSRESGLNEIEIAHRYATAQVLVSPSLHEGFGLPIIEALAQGTPVIATRTGVARGLNGEDGVIVVPVGDTVALAEAMINVVSHRANWQELNTSAAKRPVRTWDDFSKEIFDIAESRLQ